RLPQVHRGRLPGRPADRPQDRRATRFTAQPPRDPDDPGRHQARLQLPSAAAAADAAEAAPVGDTMMELTGLEPVTFALPARRSPNYVTALRRRSISGPAALSPRIRRPAAAAR